MKLARKIKAGSSSSKSEADRHVHHLVPGIKSFSKYVGLAVTLIGLLVLSGWLLGIEQLKNAFAGLPAMEANAAIAFITAGLSLWLRGSTSLKMQTAARVLGVITGLVGLLTLGEYISGRNFGIDELIFKDLAASGGLYPGRMSFMSALNFTMMGMALLLLDSDNERRYNLAQSLTLVAGLIAYAALAGYLFDVDSLYRVGVFAPMAFHTSFSFILLFVGMVCAQPEDGWVGNLIADTPGGDLLRRLLPVAFVVPILLGWLRLQGQLAGYYDTAFGTTLLAIAITLFLSVIIWFNAKGLTRVDMDRSRAEQNLRASEALYHNLFDLVPVAVYTCDANGLIQEFNHRAVELWGREPKKNDPNEKFCGSFRIFYPDGRFMPHGECPMARMISGGTLAPHELEILVERPDGLRKNVLAHPLALRNERGEIVGAINCLYDVTERKQAEQSLAEFAQQQEALYKLTDQLQRTNSLEDVFNAALNAILGALQCDRASILLFDDTGVMRFVAWRGLSDGYRKATDGHSPWKPDEKNAEPIGINDIRVAELSDSLKAIVKEEGIGSLAFIPLVSNGKLIGKFMTYFNVPHVFSEGELELSLTIAHQLAFGIDRKRTEEKLRASEALYRAIAGGIPGGGVYVVDKDMRYLVAEGPVTRAFGLSRETLEGHTVSEIFNGQIKENLEERFRKAFAGEIVSSEVERDGHIYWSQSAPLVDSIGEAIIVTLDVTERKRAENRLALLAEISEMTRKFEAPNDLLFAISKAIGEHLQVRRCLFNETDLENDLETVHRDYTNGVQSVVGVHKLSDYSSVTSAEMEAGKTVVNCDSKIDVRTAQNYEMAYAPNGERAYVAVPLMRENSWVATLWVSDDMPREWSREEVSLLETVAERTWTAIERLRIDTALRASEERYRNLFDLVPVAVYTCDSNGLIQEFNHRAVELWGREPLKNNPNEKFCGSFKIYYPDGRFMPHGECPMARVLAGETLEAHEFEILVEQPDGVRKNIIAHPLVLKNEHDEIVEAINCLYDITERKQAEEALYQLNLKLESRVQDRTATLRSVNQSLRDEITERKQAEELLRRWAHIFEHADWGIATIHQEHHVMVNPTYAKMHGYTAEELVGHPADDFFAPESRADFPKQLRIAYETGHHIFESRHIRKDGSVFPVLVNTTVVRDEDGDVLYRAVNVQDITERKLMEDALHENRRRLQILSQRLVEVQEEERRAIARELHDSVGQSLSALNINLVILDNQISNYATEQTRTRLNDSMQLTAETITLVRDVMSNLRPAVLDDYGLEAALQSYMDQFKSRYRIKILFEKPDQAIPRLGSSIEMTFLRIAQEALLNSARHARADQVTVSLWPEENAIRLSVQDNGTGIESWQEANRPGSHGLTIMRERAEAVGGNLRVVSLSGKGTKVEVSIPIENGGHHEIRKERLE